MGTTFQKLLDRLSAVRHGNYRDDPAHTEALLNEMADTLQDVLEMLRDRFEQ